MSEHFLIHQHPGKEGFYARSPGLLWSDELRCWLSADPSVIQAVQRSEAFRVVDHRHETDRIRSRLGLEFNHIAAVFAASPMSHEGEGHAAIRQRMAKYLAQRTPAALDRFGRLARTLCARHFSASGRCDAVTDVFEPLALALGHGLSGIELERYPDGVTPTQLFDRALGLNRRRTIDRRIGDIIALARRTVEPADVDTAVSLAILGSDTVLGSMALSFAERVDAHDGAPLSQIDWGERLTRTAVPFIERQAVQAAELAGQQVGAGDLIRLYLDRHAFEPAGTRDAFFGTGRHTCVGRAIAQQAWRSLGAVLAESGATLAIEHVRYREADCMFLYPVSMGVLVHGA